MARAAVAVQDPEVRRALGEHLLAIADDEFLLGHRHAEWTGFGPDLESDVALSSIAQEEMGHARLFYQQTLALAGRGAEEVDALVFDRAPADFRNALLVERPNGDWGFSIARLVLYDLADEVRLEAWSRSPLETVPDLARTLQREEKYHRMYGEAWLSRLARATPESHARMQTAVDAAWPEARGFFEAAPEEERLLEAGVLPAAAAGGEALWQERVAALFAPLEIRLTSAAAVLGGRLGRHSSDLTALLEEMTSVWRLEPGATW
ncbi:MAG: phenylacetate-CoA oxygenase subunit PaaC [Armatimonadetes bacterium]|nr:phenylacetate-CoA oxygenase subunit PaaC [Armatimonadota bacterium]